MALMEVISTAFALGGKPTEEHLAESGLNYWAGGCIMQLIHIRMLKSYSVIKKQDRQAR
jgi:hypothetical protein